MSGVGVTFGGPSAEHDISILTGLQAARSLAEAGAEVCCLYWTKTGRWKRVPLTAEAAKRVPTHLFSRLVRCSAHGCSFVRLQYSRQNLDS